MRSSCTIRSAVPEDAASIAGLADELDQVHRVAHPELFRARQPEREHGWFLATLQDAATAVLVAERKEGERAVVGFLRVRDTETPSRGALAARRFGLIDELFVAVSSRREGIADDLLEAAEAWAVSRGLEALEVTVWDFNQPAQQLYDRWGFANLRRYLRKAL
ncbi:MAG: GNAT family N-acetyltransferase [Myxococcales bacterium]|nr:MAG: GNAT family N-acetyltransferase [Myxococcales bacterium]